VFDNVEFKWRGRGNHKTWNKRFLLTLNEFSLDNEYTDVANLSEVSGTTLVDNEAEVVEFEMLVKV